MRMSYITRIQLLSQHTGGSNESVTEEPETVNPFALNATAFAPFAESISGAGHSRCQSNVFGPAPGQPAITTVEIPENIKEAEIDKEVGPDESGNPGDPGGSDPDSPGGPGAPRGSHVPSHSRSPVEQGSLNTLRTVLAGMNASSPAESGRLKVKDPEVFDGSDSQKLKGFLVSLSLVFIDHPSYFTDQKKINYMLSYLGGSAKEWFEPDILDLNLSAMPTGGAPDPDDDPTPGHKNDENKEEEEDKDDNDNDDPPPTPSSQIALHNPGNPGIRPAWPVTYNDKDVAGQGPTRHIVERRFGVAELGENMDLLTEQSKDMKRQMGTLLGFTSRTAFAMEELVRPVQQ
ncbi:hypothetical protein J3R30DRAFT_3712710 [Lentinula aciculospora]|uniref:DUF4939 domain-containing protein n=1 Tax=Lentinula aciculospora TaxID=153920 RepID=A0A9W8ZY16_9AGAR|nr:hypothetical protein J3R30DRAFT_3712710 [Lentinula aciculospora]